MSFEITAELPFRCSSNIDFPPSRTIEQITRLISLPAACLSADDAPTNVATILLRFLPRDGSRVIHAQGEIVRRSPEGLAVRFIHIDEQDQSYVDALVSHELD